MSACVCAGAQCRLQVGRQGTVSGGKAAATPYASTAACVRHLLATEGANP